METFSPLCNQTSLTMDVEHARTIRDAAAHEVSLTVKADHAAEILHKSEAEVSQYVSDTVEV